jgi:hypothetical protein
MTTSSAHENRFAGREAVAGHRQVDKRPTGVAAIVRAFHNALHIIDHGSAADALGNGVVVRRTTTIVNADETAPTITEESSHSPTILLM